MARIAILYHPPGTRVFAAAGDHAIPFTVRGLRIDEGSILSGQANHELTPDGGGASPIMPYGDLFLDAEAAIRAYAAYGSGTMLRPRAETQATTVEWTAACYPGEVGDLRAKVLNVIEEAGELSTESGIPVEEAVERFRASASRPPSTGDRAVAISKEIGDLGIALYDMAEVHGVEADGCRDLAMAVNRTRTPEDCAARVVAKRVLGVGNAPAKDGPDAEASHGDARDDAAASDPVSP